MRCGRSWTPTIPSTIPKRTRSARTSSRTSILVSTAIVGRGVRLSRRDRKRLHPHRDVGPRVHLLATNVPSQCLAPGKGIPRGQGSRPGARSRPLRQRRLVAYPCLRVGNERSLPQRPGSGEERHRAARKTRGADGRNRKGAHGARSIPRPAFPRSTRPSNAKRPTRIGGSSKSGPTSSSALPRGPAPREPRRSGRWIKTSSSTTPTTGAEITRWTPTPFPDSCSPTVP